MFQETDVALSSADLMISSSRCGVTFMRMRSILLTMVCLGIPAVGQAAASSDYEVTYFREAALKNEVGHFYKPCGTGAARLTGKRTRFFVKSSSRCPGAGRPVGNGTLSCRFTDAGCTDALVGRLLPIRTPRPN
ncbi:hypothetical protein [Sphingomonas solaris]|uniref:Uncharacterized protein n=1 Tax=Alterirhizorhabdus solaris TaxID=2529389 RepID=A0A558R6M5_9SPHN|nr:hypothetical protein [Sphingomonas solaris]TVV74978.1 hypothetical protein FOY91_08345 [Sphingomonas solaris]